MLRTFPFYIKSTVILVGLVVFVYALSRLGDVCIPLGFSLMLAILLNPVVNYFQQRLKFPQMIAIPLAILLAMVLLAGIGFLIFKEIGSFADQLPLFKKKVEALSVKMQGNIVDHFGITIQKQKQYLQQAESGIKPIVASMAGSLLGSISFMVLIPVYSFLFLYYKNLLLNFLYEVFAEKNAEDVSKVLLQTKEAIQQYMLGLIIEAVIVATLNSIALLILGVDYAILLGVLGALLNVLPFIGGIIAVLLPVLIATLTKDGFHTQLMVILAYALIQFIDNHFLVPYIVSSKVKINALISLIIVFLGGLLWGIAGMFLSIPFIGVMKIIFDRVPELKPWGKLLGTETPTRRNSLRQKWSGQNPSSNKNKLVAKKGKME